MDVIFTRGGFGIFCVSLVAQCSRGGYSCVVFKARGHELVCKDPLRCWGKRTSVSSVCCKQDAHVLWSTLTCRERLHWTGRTPAVRSVCCVCFLTYVDRCVGAQAYSMAHISAKSLSKPKPMQPSVLCNEENTPVKLTTCYCKGLVRRQQRNLQ